MTKKEALEYRAKLADMLTEKQQVKRVEREINKARRNKPLSIFQ
jgi:hypothetical protein